MTAVHFYSSPLGGITVYSDGENITGLYFSDKLTGIYSNAEEKPLPIFEQADKWLDIYFSGKEPDFTPLLKIEGSEFQKAVCGIMQSIPFGHVMTYSEVAERLKGTSPRAVGRAAAMNRISLIIPCHRVIGTNGSLTGYGGGIERKLKLLELEGAETSKFFIPPTL
ncbi:MAG: methylated-DNA--[Synergistaceae bacterium]|nr:methylated-DNA--[protein]-cysteine S-methyltransferase [Synergistaceae bacterium]